MICFRTLDYNFKIGKTKIHEKNPHYHGAPFAVIYILTFMGISVEKSEKRSTYFTIAQFFVNVPLLPVSIFKTFDKNEVFLADFVIIGYTIRHR